MEYIPGCTVRSFLNIPITQQQPLQQQKSSSLEEEEPCAKKQRLSESEKGSTKYVTRLDEYATKVAYQIGVIIAKMHNANIVHGDLTTSNMMLRNSCHVPCSISDNSTTANTILTDQEWTPDIVLIDFGLSSTSANTKKTSSHEERAVDLYVLERSFVTTHVGSEDLVKEIMRGYKATCQSSDSVFVRLAQVRLRGRKRECFG
jgi:TP53 regulating kinase-like protein